MYNSIGKEMLNQPIKDVLKSRQDQIDAVYISPEDAKVIQDKAMAVERAKRWSGQSTDFWDKYYAVEENRKETF